jgi:hypothetical protein
MSETQECFIGTYITIISNSSDPKRKNVFNGRMRTLAAVQQNGVELWRWFAAQVGVLFCLSMVEDEDEGDKKHLLAEP